MVIVHSDDERDYQWVDYADYLALQAALREALDKWQRADNRGKQGGWDYSDEKHIAEFRKQFLDEGTP